MLLADEGTTVVLSLSFGDSLSIDELCEPLGQGGQLALDLGDRRGDLGLIAPAKVGEH